MGKISKEDIDYIFQKGTDRNEFPFKESSWDNMEAMLEADDKKRIYTRYLLIGLVLLSVSAIVYSVFNKENTVNKKEETIEIPIATIEKPVSTESQNTFIAESSVIENSINENSNSKINKTLSESNNNLVDDASQDIIIEDTKNKINSSTISHSNTLTNKAQNNYTLPISQSYNNNLTTISEENDLKNVQDKISSTDVVSTNNEIVNETNTVVRGDIKINSLLPATPLNLLSNSNQLVEHKPVDMIKLKKNRLSYNLILAQDWSSVGTMSNSKRGFRFGAELAYQFGEKFQVGAGFIVSRKQYETSGDNYTPQAQFRWVSDAPQTVSGTCNIFEIPLETTYYFKGYDKNSFFITAGVSSYIMNSEWYDFVWEDQAIMADPNIAKSRSSAELDRKCLHLFGIGTVNAGYQKYLNKNIAVQIGPYIQLPFTGIGMGSVDLFSTGLQMKVAFAK